MMKQYRLVYYMRGFIHNSKRFFPSLDCFRNFRFEWKEFMKGLERLSSSSRTWSFKQKARSWLYGSLEVKQRFPWSSTTWASHVKTRRLSHGKNKTATCSIRIATSSHGLESPAVWLSHLPLHLLQFTHHSLLFYYWIILPLLSFA